MSMASSNESYPWPSTLNISNFVSIKPWLQDKETSTNYKIWKQQMLCLLESQDLLGFINGEIQIPENRNESSSSNGKSVEIDNHKLWRRTDRLVKGWIFGTIGDDVLNSLEGLNTSSSSREVWLEVENIFSEKESVNAFQNDDLKSESEDVMQEEDPIVEVESEISTNTVDEKGRGKSNLEYFRKYIPLYQAAVRGDWEIAKKIFDKDKEAAQVYINLHSQTALHVALERGSSNDFVKKLLELMSNDALALKDRKGYTALHVAAMGGNKEVVIMLVNKNHGLLYILNDEIDLLPVHLAAVCCHKDVLSYMIVKSKENVDRSPFVGKLGIRLLIYVIMSEFLDVALELVKTYPDMATLKEDEDGLSALNVLAKMSRVFPSGARFNWWQKFIYSRIPLTLTPKTSYVGDIENIGINSQESNSTNGGTSKLIAIVWTVIEHLVPAIKVIRHKKLLHKQAIELVKFLCQKPESWSNTEAAILRKSILTAADFGIHEVVELIAETILLAHFYFHHSTWDRVISLAIGNRHENVYNSIYQMNHVRNSIHQINRLQSILSEHEVDNTWNNLMHKSAKLAPPYKLNRIPGAALQMQRELLWFKEIESFSGTSTRELKNEHGQTPRMLFTKEHEDLKQQGEKWMKDTASSCSITAALIVTVVFAAAFTVPGNVDSNTGIPIFWDKTPFILFAISDIISLFTSVTSLLMFLSILTSRYAEEDFFQALPNRLCIGLLTLFISIIFMMLAFCATAYLTFSKKFGSLLILPLAILACLSITSFAFLQFPILLDVVYATHSSGIFHKKSDRSL